MEHMSKPELSAQGLIMLPEAGVWKSASDIEAYAEACIRACGLHGWQMSWDRALSRLGACRMTRRVVSLSRYFVQVYLEKDPELIRRTLLHELAHALAWKHNGDREHKAVWRFWCAALGIPDERAREKCEDFRPAHLVRRPKYALCHRETGEVFRYYYRKPKISSKDLSVGHIRGRKAETLGKLCLVEVHFDPKNA